MITVPRKVVPEVQSRAIPNVTQNINAPQGTFGDGGKALMQSADALDKLGATLDKRATDIQSEQNAARSLELTTMAKKEVMDKIYNPETGILTRKGGNALGAQAEMEKTMADIKQKYGQIDGDNKDLKDMVGKSLSSLEESTVDLARRHQFSELQSYKTEQLAAVQTLNTEDVALNFNDEKNFTAKWDENLKALNAQSAQEGWSPEQFGMKKTQLYSNMRSAQIVAMIGQDTPDGILKAKEVYDEAQARGMLTFEDATKMDKMFDAALPQAAAQKAYIGLGASASLTSEEQILSYVVDKLEGGDKIANEPKGAVAKFGINSLANPDVDVKNLDRKGAMELYKSRYWNAIGANELPESIRFVAFDTAVNHGVAKAKELIEKANGNPRVLIDLRYKEYLRLAKSDPAEYAKYLPAWKNRLADLSSQITSNPSTDVVTKAAAQLDLQYAGAGQELLKLHEKTQEKQVQIQKQSQKDFLDTVMPVLYQNNGDWSVLTAQQKAKAIELDVWKDITNFKGVTNPAIGVKVAQMTPDEIMSTDFSEGQWRGNLSQTDYESIVKKQTDLRDKPAARGEFRTTRDIVSQAWKSIGKKTDDPEYYVFQGAVEDAFAMELENRGGKAMSADDKKAVVSKLVLNSSVGAGFFDGGQKRVYQLDPEQSYLIGDNDPKLVESAISVLIQNNQEPSQKNIQGFIENPSDFIKVDGYDEGDIGKAVQTLMRVGAPVSASTVKSLLEKRKNG